MNNHDQKGNQKDDGKEEKKLIKIKIINIEQLKQIKPIKRLRDSSQSQLFETFKYGPNQHRYDDSLIGSIRAFANVLDATFRF